MQVHPFALTVDIHSHRSCDAHSLPQSSGAKLHVVFDCLERPLVCSNKELQKLDTLTGDVRSILGLQMTPPCQAMEF